MIRIDIVAGEASGDRLAAVAALRARCGAIEVEGVAGPAMIAEGCRALYPSERLAVMGIPEVVRRYAELSRMRRALIGHLTAHPPDCFIGVDAPEFNLRLLVRLRARHTDGAVPEPAGMGLARGADGAHRARRRSHAGDRPRRSHLRMSPVSSKN